MIPKLSLISKVDHLLTSFVKMWLAIGPIRSTELSPSRKLIYLLGLVGDLISSHGQIGAVKHFDKHPSPNPHGGCTTKDCG